METEKGKHVPYVAEPTACLFHKSDKFFRLLQGPVGCGKTSACVMEIMMRALAHPPGADGVRKPRWVAIRATYPKLKATTIKTWQQWVPEDKCPIVYDTPIRGRFVQDLPDGTTLDFEIVFMALENERDVTNLQSLEVNGAWLNETSEIGEEIFTFLKGRVSRWKPDKDDTPRWKGIIGDTNPPKTTHWIYRLFEEMNTPPEFEMFKYPPAVYFDSDIQQWVPNPDAENIGPGRLDSDYYTNQIIGSSEDYIRVMLAGEYGMTRVGKPVFPQFSERDHVAKTEIVGDRSQPLILGFDFGGTLHPACVFAQVNSLGGLVLLDCFHAENEDLESFLDDYILPVINKKYARFKIQGVGDPSARGRSGLNKSTAFLVCKERGLHVIPASTNDFVPRKEAVDHFLNKRNGLQVNPSLTYLREAFGGGYVYGEIKNQKGRTKERPDKNDYSHGMDAVQYIALYVKYGSGAQKVRKFFSRSSEEKKRFLWA